MIRGEADREGRQQEVPARRPRRTEEPRQEEWVQVHRYGPLIEDLHLTRELTGGLPHLGPPIGKVFCRARDRPDADADDEAGGNVDGGDPDTAAIIDSQSVRSAEKGGPRSIRTGWNAGKKINGKKRHVLVDTQGLLMQAIVHSAEVQDRDGGVLLLSTLLGRFRDSPAPIAERRGSHGRWQGDGCGVGPAANRHR